MINLDFSKLRILVIGDLMLDKYLFCNVDRISPEAPVPIVHVRSEKYVPGGAANVSNNIVSLGAKSILLGVVGDDEPGKRLLDVMEGVDKRGIIIDNDRPTTQKIRIVSRNQQLLRLDYEETTHHFSDQLLKKIELLIPECDIIIVSDYAKGTINAHTMRISKEKAAKHSKKIIADTRPQHKLLYDSVFLITPNRKESEELTGFKINDENSLKMAGKELIQRMKCNVLITLGEDGMCLFEKDKEPLHLKTQAQQVFDVSGAGDTVVSVLSLALASGLDLSMSAKIANAAAGIVVGKLGTSTLTMQELNNALQKN